MWSFVCVKKLGTSIVFLRVYSLDSYVSEGRQWRGVVYKIKSDGDIMGIT